MHFIIALKVVSGIMLFFNFRFGLVKMKRGITLRNEIVTLLISLSYSYRVWNSIVTYPEITDMSPVTDTYQYIEKLISKAPIW